MRACGVNGSPASNVPWEVQCQRVILPVNGGRTEITLGTHSMRRIGGLGGRFLSPYSTRVWLPYCRRRDAARVVIQALFDEYYRTLPLAIITHPQVIVSTVVYSSDRSRWRAERGNGSTPGLTPIQCTR